MASPIISLRFRTGTPLCNRNSLSTCGATSHHNMVQPTSNTQSSKVSSAMANHHNSVDPTSLVSLTIDKVNVDRSQWTPATRLTIHSCDNSRFKIEAVLMTTRLVPQRQHSNINRAIKEKRLPVCWIDKAVSRAAMASPNEQIPCSY